MTLQFNRFYLTYFLAFSLILGSCETEFSNTFIIKNNTNHKVKITGYVKSTKNDTSTYNEEILINPFEEYKVIKNAGYHSENQGVFYSRNIDSIIINFDNSKKITYTCQQPIITHCSGKYNIINYKENYVSAKTGKSSGKDEFTYTYLLNESDYISSDSIK
jgi:hypothetical protein